MTDRLIEGSLYRIREKTSERMDVMNKNLLIKKKGIQKENKGEKVLTRRERMR